MTTAWFRDTTALCVLLFTGSLFGQTPIDIRSYGATCNGSDVNTSVQAAITASNTSGSAVYGNKNVLIPAGCLWQVPSGAVPAGFIFVGENMVTSVMQAGTSPSTTQMAFGPLSGSRNINLQCAGATTPTYNPDWSYYNGSASSSNYYASTGQQGFTMDTDGPADHAGIQVRSHGQGDALYGQADYTNGAAFRAGTFSNGSYAFIAQLKNNAYGFYIFDDPGSAPTASYPFLYQTSSRTSGNILDLQQHQSGYSGTAINMNMASNIGGGYGTFSGYFISAANQGTIRFTVDSAGNLYSVGKLSSNSIDVNSLVVNSSLGVGTLSPSAPLEVSDPVANKGIRITSGAGSSALNLYTTDTTSGNRNWVVRNRYNDYGLLEFSYGASLGADPSIVAMSINRSGNVGIGTTTQNSRLAVVGLSAHANNAAAIGAGLAVGDFYRTGGDPDLVAVVH